MSKMAKKKITFIDLFACIGSFHTAMHSVEAKCSNFEI